MLIQDTATDHSNGKLWNLNVEKIFLKSQGLDKVNHLQVKSKYENNPIPVFYFERAAQPLNHEKHVVCIHFRLQNICFIFWKVWSPEHHVTYDVTAVSILYSLSGLTLA